jgi:hypothetical protein
MSDLHTAVVAARGDLHAPLGHQAMGAILLAARRWRGYERRLFGARAPHWFQDTIGSINWLKPLKYIPTFAAILFVPAHFFRRAPRLRFGRSGPFMRPLAFFWGSIALLAVSGTIDVYNRDLSLDLSFADWIDGYVRQRGAGLAFLLWITSPVWLAILSLVLFPFAWWLYMGDWLDTNPTLCLVALAPSTYLAIVWRKLFWNSLYFAVYLLPVVPAIASVAPALTAVRGASFVDKAMMLMPLVWIVVRPYVAMLKASVDVPTRIMLAAEIENVASRARAVAWRQSDASVNVLGRQLNATLKAFRLAELDLKRRHQERLFEYCALRARLFTEVNIGDLEYALRVGRMTAWAQAELASVIVIARRLTTPVPAYAIDDLVRSSPQRTLTGMVRGTHPGLTVDRRWVIYGGVLALAALVSAYCQPS